jgi:hypothetical protein
MKTSGCESFFAIPKIRRQTHSYCTKCGISKEYYSESICSKCNNTTFSDGCQILIPESKWKNKYKKMIQSKKDFPDDFDDSITMSNLFGH